MKIQQLDLTVRALVADYRDDGDGGEIGLELKRRYIVGG